MEALIQLMESNKLDKISMSQIATIAEVNRSTIYRFFEDKYDIIESREDQFFEELRQARKNFSSSDLNPKLIKIKDPLYGALIVIKSNRHFLKIVLGKNGEASFPWRFKNFMLQETSEYEQLIEKIMSGVKTELVNIYHISAIFGIIQFWISDDALTIEEVYNFFKIYSQKLLS
ncbi:TetR/AcrR family transcriptional regulator [Lactococcus lactis]|uniref:TetR/AcrR family transcriptional regulator n=1 Tax=Lactococcus lactis TaxID=1358 RepID=A0A9X4NI87_9LACT|nr:TetR/AcrR family transcriptional regulator [Lactococcus lactis]MDG4984179.1 TetR/AcrR family transcriptional regulator [Lactococcus lactis]